MFEDIPKGAKFFYDFAMANPYLSIGIFFFILIFAVIIRFIKLKERRLKQHYQ